MVDSRLQVAEFQRVARKEERKEKGGATCHWS